jgi:hypothetical protein
MGGHDLTGRGSHQRCGLLTAVVSAVALMAVGCGSSSTSSSKSTATPTTKTSTPASTTAASSSTSSLSGTWSGQYGGAYQGTFKLNWKQAGSNLVGTIKLSSPSGTLPTPGTVTGSSIRFGTVGGFGITCTGSVSGSSMSGGYQAGNGSGTWSASKS